MSVLVAILDKTLIGTEDAAALRKTLVRQVSPPCLRESAEHE